MTRAIAVMLVCMAALSVAVAALAPRRFEPIYEGGGIQVYFKQDFDSGENIFAAEASGAVQLVEGAGQAVSGRSLHVARRQSGGYFGARTEQIGVRNTPGLKIAFCVRAKGMEHVTVNFFDAKQRDNSTPTSPARVLDDQWRTVVFAVEDFHFNSDPPQKKIKVETEHTSLMFHGQEKPGASGQFWIDKLVVYRGRDSQPPEKPTGLEAVEAAPGRIELRWQEPADNVFAAVYSIYRRPADGQPGSRWLKIAESIEPRYIDRVPQPGRYEYCVTAADYDNNVSAPSAKAMAGATADGGTPAAPGVQEQDRMAYAENVRRIHSAGSGKVRHDVFLFAGDSITAAHDYTHILGQWLARGITVRQGVGTVRTDYGKAMIGKYLAESRPQFAIVMYGTNDSKSPEAVAQAMQNLSAIIDACAAAGTVPIMATIPPRGYDKQKQEDQLRFNKALVELCRQKRIPVSYCFEEMMEHDLRQILGDGVHLTPVTGNDVAGAALWKTMQQVYFALRDTSHQW